MKECLHQVLCAWPVHGTRVAAVCLLGALLCSCSPNPLDVAARGELDLLRSMVENDPSVVTYRTRDTKKTPLHHAVTYRKLAVVEFLIEHGADVNAIDWTGMTPLHIAATMNQIAVAKALVRAGADVEAADKFGDRPLHSAALHGRIQMIDYLILEANAIRDKRNIENLTPEELALKERKLEAAKRLRDLGD